MGKNTGTEFGSKSGTISGEWNGTEKVQWPAEASAKHAGLWVTEERRRRHGSGGVLGSEQAVLAQEGNLWAHGSCSKHWEDSHVEIRLVPKDPEETWLARQGARPFSTEKDPSSHVLLSHSQRENGLNSPHRPPQLPLIPDPAQAAAPRPSTRPPTRPGFCLTWPDALSVCDTVKYSFA